jgi:ABC-2 type transport system ATP-binding protein
MSGKRSNLPRALQHRPRILFLDEPTAGLDPQTRNQIWEFIRALSRDEHVTVFFTTHYMEEAERVADEVAVIDHGRIVAEAPPRCGNSPAGALWRMRSSR